MSKEKISQTKKPRQEEANGQPNIHITVEGAKIKNKVSGSGGEGNPEGKKSARIQALEETVAKLIARMEGTSSGVTSPDSPSAIPAAPTVPPSAPPPAPPAPPAATGSAPTLKTAPEVTPTTKVDEDSTITPVAPESAPIAPAAPELRDEGIEATFAGKSKDKTGEAPPAPASKGPKAHEIPAWRRRGHDDALLNPREAGPAPFIGRNAALEHVTNGGHRPDKIAFAEYVRTQKEHDELAAKRREARSEKFAEDNGLTQLRNAKIFAERTAYLEEKDWHRNVFKRFSPGAWSKRSDARAKADKATLEWSKALSEKGAVSPELKSKLGMRNDIKSELFQINERIKNESNPKKRRELESKLGARKDELEKTFKTLNLTPEESKKAHNYYEALVLRKRDTLVGPNASRTQARIDALSERDQTRLGKVSNWLMGGGPLKLPFQVLSATSTGIGKAGFWLFGNKNLRGAELERSQARWLRAGQIVTGAALGTALGWVIAPASLAASAGIGVLAGVATVRTILGQAGGAVGAKGAKTGVENTFNKWTKAGSDKQIRNTEIENTKDLRKQQEAVHHGSRQTRQKRAQDAAILGAVVGGGVASVGVGLEANQLLGLPSVQNALHMHTQPSGAVPHTPEHPATPTHPTTGEKLELQIGGKNAEGVTLNDLDKLFGHFGLMLQRDFATVPHTDTPAIDTYLKLLEPKGGHGISLHTGEDNIARHFGFEANQNLSEVMHKGDTIALTNNHEVIIRWADHARSPHVLIDAKGVPNTDIRDITKHLGAVHHVEHAAQTPAHSAEQAAQTPTQPDQGQPTQPSSLDAGATAIPPQTIASPEALSQTVAHLRETQSISDQYANLQSEHARLVDLYQKDPTSSDYGAALSQYNDHTAAYQMHAGTSTPETAATSNTNAGASPESASAQAPVGTDTHVAQPESQPQTPATVEPSHTDAPTQPPSVSNDSFFAETFKNAPPSVNTLIHTQGWENMSHVKSIDVFRNPPAPDETLEIILRSRFLDVVRDSGINPVDNQSVEQYIEIASKAIQDRATH